MVTAVGSGAKRAVKDHWESEPCGTRGFDTLDRRRYFQEIERERYAFEPYIKSFAAFDESRGRTVLEVGVGAGTDYVNWLRAGAKAHGIDLTHAALALTQERSILEGLRPKLSQSDAESLPFRDDTFDIVYSYGVIHHSPSTANAVAEIHRVTKRGGTAKVMVYHVPSITGFILWGVHCLLPLRPWRSPRWAIANHLESPGTKAYTIADARALFSAFSTVRTRTVLGTGDLLKMRPSAKYQNLVAALVWRLYPRWLIAKTGSGLGLGLLIEAVK